MRRSELSFDDFNTLYNLSAIWFAKYTEEHKASIQNIVRRYPQEDDKNHNSSLHALILYLEDFSAISPLDKLGCYVESIFNPLLWAMQGELDSVNAQGETALRMLFLSNLSENHKFKIALKFLDAGASLAKGIECENSKQLCCRLFRAKNDIIEDSLEYVSFKFKILSHPAFVQVILKQTQYFVLEQNREFIDRIGNAIPVKLRYSIEDATKYINEELAALNSFSSQTALPQETCSKWIEKFAPYNTSYISFFITCVTLNSNFISYPVYDIIEKLEEIGVNLDAKLAFISNSTALHTAVNCQNYQVIQALIDLEVNASIQNKFGDTPLHIACLIGDLKVVNYIIQKVVSTNVKNRLGDTPLITASIWGHLEIIQSLIKAGANVNARGNCKRSALYHAASYNDIVLVKLLINKGANVNSTDKFGETPLIVASRLGHYCTVNYLIKIEGINLNACDLEMEGNALHWAVKFGQTDVVRLLLNAGIDVDAISKEGTAFDISLVQQNSGIINAIKSTAKEQLLLYPYSCKSLCE